MIKQIKLSKQQARQFILAHQKLLIPRKLQGKKGILEFINLVGCIQFDPLNQVGKNPDLVLQSRIENYKPDYLSELLYSERKLLDGWDKNMSIYPVEDWPYFSRYREESYNRHINKLEDINKILPEIRKELDKKGPLSSIDLKFDIKVDWYWAPTRAARAALESMYYWGELIIYNKVGTRKVYDFTAKHLSKELLTMPDPNSSTDHYLEWHVKRRIRSVGLLWNRASDAWLGIRNMKSKERSETISRLEENQKILSVDIEGVKYPFYIRKEEEALLSRVLDGIELEPQVSFIAPLDNLLWDRKIIKEIFGFEYTWEVYKPVPQREYGYYVLPVLYKDRFVARFEPKFNKKTKRLEIINWWWETDVVKTKEMEKAMKRGFDDFLNYLGATDIQLSSDTSKKKELSWLNAIVD